MEDPTVLISETTNMSDILKYISFSTLGLIVAGLYKFYLYTKNQTIKEEDLKNKIFNLERDVIDSKSIIDALKNKIDGEFKMILERIEKVSEIQTAKTEEIKNLIIELFRDR